MTDNQKISMMGFKCVKKLLLAILEIVIDSTTIRIDFPNNFCSFALACTPPFHFHLRFFMYITIDFLVG